MTRAEEMLTLMSQGLSPDEIAARMETTRNNVYVTVHRALKEGHGLRRKHNAEKRAKEAAAALAAPAAE